MSNNKAKRVGFQLSDFVRGDDGELYHLPTLRNLMKTGKLPTDSPAYRIICQNEVSYKRILA